MALRAGFKGRWVPVGQGVKIHLMTNRSITLEEHISLRRR